MRKRERERCAIRSCAQEMSPAEIDYGGGVKERKEIFCLLRQKVSDNSDNHGMISPATLESGSKPLRSPCACVAFILFFWIGEIGLSVVCFTFLLSSIRTCDKNSYPIALPCLFCPLFCVTVADKQGLCTTKRPAQCGYVSSIIEFLAAKIKSF